MDCTNIEAMELMEEELRNVSRCSSQQKVTDFYGHLNNEVTGDWGLFNYIFDLIIKEESGESGDVKKLLALVLEHHFHFREWKYWTDSESGKDTVDSPTWEQLMKTVKDPVTFSEILKVFKTTSRSQVGYKELLGDLLVCISLPKTYSDGTKVDFDENHEIWMYTLDSLKDNETYIDGLILSSCFVKKSIEHHEILNILSEICDFLPQLPKLITSVLHCVENKSVYVTELAVKCLFDLAQLGSSVSTEWYTYTAFFRTIINSVRKLKQDEKFKELQAACHALSNGLENMDFSSVFRNYGRFLIFFLDLAVIKRLNDGVRVAALNVLIAGLQNTELERWTWMPKLVMSTCELIVETNVPTNLSYFDVASWSGGEKCMFTSAIRLLELLGEKLTADTFLNLTMSHVEKYIEGCCNAKFAAYVILGIAVRQGNKLGESFWQSSYCGMWKTALELGAFDCHPPSPLVAGLIFAINESCEHLEILSVGNSNIWTLNSLRTYLTYLFSCLQTKPGNVYLQQVAMRTFDSLATIIASLDADQESICRGIMTELLSEFCCNNVSHLNKQILLHGILMLVDKCENVVRKDYIQLCDVVITYITAVKENDLECVLNSHNTSLCCGQKLQLYVVCVDILQRLLLIENLTDNSLFQTVFDRLLILYHTFDDPDLHTLILKYFRNFSSKIGESVNVSIITSILKCVQQSLEADDGLLIDNKCNYKYSLYFANIWTKIIRGTDEDILSSSWRSHVQGVPERQIQYPHQTERIEAIKLLQALCYNIGQSFRPYLDLAIQILTVTLYDSSIPVRVQAIESLSTFLCYKERVTKVKCSLEIYSVALLAVDAVRSSRCVELKIVCMESIEMFLKFSKILEMNRRYEFIWSCISDVLLDRSQKYADDEINRILDLKKICINTIPHFANATNRLNFSQCFLSDEITGVFRTILSPQFSCGVEEFSLSSRILNLQRDSAGVIGDCMKFVGNHMSYIQTKGLYDILESGRQSEDLFVRCNAIYSVGEMLYCCDCQDFLSEFIPLVSQEYVEFAEAFQTEMLPREKANIFGALAKMTVAGKTLVDLDDILGVILSYGPLTEDCEEYENVLNMLLMLLTIPNNKVKLECYVQRILNMCSDIRFCSFPSSCPTKKKHIIELVDYLDKKICQQFPKPDDEWWE